LAIADGFLLCLVHRVLDLINLWKAVNTLTIYERLDDATRKALGAKPVHRHSVRSKENLSERDIKELTGVNRDTYKRSKGRVKRK